MLAAVEVIREEFRTFYEQNFHTVWRQLRRLRVREEDVADLAHEVLVLAYRRFDEIPPSPNGWLSRVSFEMVRNYRRKAWRRLERLTPLVIEEALSESSDDITEVVLEALDRMPEEQRTLLLRYHVADELLQALAKEFGIAPSTLQLRIATAERSFEGWVKTLLGVDPGTGSRSNLFVPFTIAGLLPKVSEFSEVAAQAQFEGWARLEQATASTPAPRSFVQGGLRIPGISAKLTAVFAVGVPAAFVGMLLGHLGHEVASAHDAAPSLHAAMTPIAVIAEALVKNTLSPGGPAPLAQASQTPSIPKDSGMDPELALLRFAKNQLAENRPQLVLRILQEYAVRYPKNTHTEECASLKKNAEYVKAFLDAQKAAEEAAKNAAAADKPKP